MSLDSDPQLLQVNEHKARIARQRLEECLGKIRVLQLEEGGYREELQRLENERVRLLQGREDQE
jgi:hypothetical protein